MRITCPQCHSRCRLKTDTAINDASQGKCPECGHIFHLPPGTSQEESTTSDHSGKAKKAGFDPGFKMPDIGNFLRPLLASRKALLFWVVSGLSLALLVAALLIGQKETPPPRPEQNAASSSSSATTELRAKLSLTPQARAKAISQIKHHALVGDADISVSDNQLQLALLVSGNTPVTYAERLGRQFAHYLREQLTATHKQEQKPAIKVSVYYPGGTRIEVTTNDQSGEEEVLPQNNDE